MEGDCLGWVAVVVPRRMSALERGGEGRGKELKLLYLKRGEGWKLVAPAEDL